MNLIQRIKLILSHTHHQKLDKDLVNKDFSQSHLGLVDFQMLLKNNCNETNTTTNITVDNPTPCEDNEISKISETIKDFTQR